MKNAYFFCANIVQVKCSTDTQNYLDKKYISKELFVQKHENIYKHRHALEVLTQTNTETQVCEHTRTSQHFFAILLRFESKKIKTPIYLSSLSIKRRIVEISLAKLAKEGMNKNCVAERPLFLLFLKQHFCLIPDNGLLIKISTKGKQLNNT